MLGIADLAIPLLRGSDRGERSPVRLQVEQRRSIETVQPAHQNDVPLIDMATKFDVTGAVRTPLTGLHSTKSANFQYPTGEREERLPAGYVLVTGSDGEAVVVSEGEIDPSFGGINVSMTDIAAYQQDGTTISPALDRPGRCE